MFPFIQSHANEVLLADLSPAERKRILRKAQRGLAAGRPVYWLFFLAWPLVFPCLKTSSFVANMTVSCGYWVVVCILIARIESRKLTSRVRRELAALNRCAGCGYDLHASEGTCPECGSPI